MSCILKVCIVAAQLTSLDISSPSSIPMYDKARTYDGTVHDVSKFYTKKNNDVSGSGYLILNTNTKVDLGYKAGFESDKYSTSDTYRVGITQLQDIDENSFLTFGASTTIGGKSSHRPCKDSYDREYFCGNLTSWSDHKKETSNESNHNFNINYTFRF